MEYQQVVVYTIVSISADQSPIGHWQEKGDVLSGRVEDEVKYDDFVYKRPTKGNVYRAKICLWWKR